MVYTLRQDKDFAPFLLDTAVWLKQTAAAPNRGLIDDVGEDTLKKRVKVSNLNSALRYITQWVPHYLANNIEKQSTSIESLWSFIRKYYSFQQSEAQFMKLSSITGSHAGQPHEEGQQTSA